MVEEGSVVPVLGAGVLGWNPRCRATRRADCKQIRTEDSDDLAEVAQRVAVTVGQAGLERAISKPLRPSPNPRKYTVSSRASRGVWGTGAPERYQMIVTTNYDSPWSGRSTPRARRTTSPCSWRRNDEGTREGSCTCPWKDEPRAIASPAAIASSRSTATTSWSGR